MLNEPAVAITLYLFLYGIGKLIGKKTKGVFSEALFLSLVYVVGFMTGIFSKDNLNSTGVPAMMADFGLMLMVTNLGTMINLKRFLKEWKTVVICLGALAVMILLFVSVGTAVFGRYYALSAISPVAGGIVATNLVSEAAQAAEQPEFGAFAALVCSLQSFVGFPISAVLLRKYCEKVVKSKAYVQEEKEEAAEKKKKAFLSNLKIDVFSVAKLSLVMMLGMKLSSLTGGKLPAAVSVMVLGIVFTEVGFLDRNTLTVSGFMPFLMMGLVMLLPNSFNSITVSSFGSMLLPALFFLALGAASLALGGLIMGKVLKTDVRLSAAVALSAMFGYPGTEIIVNDVCESFDVPEEERQSLHQMIMPQMIIAGFATVTIASVIIAGVVTPAIF